MRPTAGNAALRPAQNSSRSSSEFEALQRRPRGIRGRSRSTRSIRWSTSAARPVELDDQQRLDVERIAGVDEFLGGVDRGLVHHLHAARDDARADDARDAFAGVLRRGKPTSTARAVSGFFRMRTVTSVTTPSRPSEPVTMPSRS